MHIIETLLDGMASHWWIGVLVLIWWAVFWISLADRIMTLMKWVRNRKYRKIMQRTAEIRKKRLE